MPVVRLPESTYERLQSHAKPFTDTPATVVDRLLDHYEGRNDGSSQDGSTSKERGDLMSLDPQSPPDLRFTKVLEASVDGRNVTGPRGPNWNRLLMVAHESALDEIGSFRKLSRFSDTNIKRGKHTGGGYHYNADADYDFSMQNKPANDAWADSLKLAQDLGLSISVVFEWREKEKAAYPGRTALLEWPEK
jgi:hypothetical protein